MKQLQVGNRIYLYGNPDITGKIIAKKIGVYQVKWSDGDVTFNTPDTLVKVNKGGETDGENHYRNNSS